MGGEAGEMPSREIELEMQKGQSVVDSIVGHAARKAFPVTVSLLDNMAPH